MESGIRAPLLAWWRPNTSSTFEFGAVEVGKMIEDCEWHPV